VSGPSKLGLPSSLREHRERAIAVAIHDVEPATYERCALIRDWLDDHGIERVTLLVIPAPDLHPFFQRSPALAAWLLDCRDRGDAIAQHGFQHRRTQRPGPVRSVLAAAQGGRAAEFPGLDADGVASGVAAGRRVLELAGLQPRGFVAPAYAYTPALRSELRAGFAWWGTLLRLVRPGGAELAPALCLGTSSLVKRATSPLVVRAGALTAGPLLRLDLHPADFDHPRHVLALEAVLRGARRRTAVTYDELA
jgi:predicted deacetylase